MAQPLESYHWVFVESFEPERTSGLHGKVHIRPLPNQLFPTNLHVRCPKKMVDTNFYVVGTCFRVKGKLTDKEGSRPFLHCPHQWSATLEGRIEMGEKVILNIKTFADGHRPPDQVVPGML
jgi:hypothetical protein